MKKRIISAAILVPILFLLTLAAPVIAASLVMSALMAIAAYELLYRTGLVKRPRLVIYSCIMAAAVCMMGLAGEIGWANMQPGDGNSTYRNRIIDAIFNMTGDALEEGAKYELR